jgi:tyrosine-protein kinase Etk/Wzc
MDMRRRGGMNLEAIQEQIRDLDAQDAANEVHLLDLLILLSKRRKFILWFTFGVAVLTAIVVLLVPSKFTATTVVLPPGQNSSMASTLLNQLGGSSSLASLAGGGLGIKSSGDMYVSLFRSRTVEDALIQRFGLMSRYKTKTMADVRKAFEERSTVILGAKDGLIRITVTDRDPKMAAAIANAYVEEFRKLSDHLAITEASQRRVFFQQQLVEANQNLAAAEEALKHTEQTTGVLQVDSQARSLIESGALLRGQVVAKEVELQAMRSYATEDNPQMVIAEQQLDALKSQLAKLGASDANSSSDIIVPKGNIPQAGMEYVRKLRDEKYYETIFELIAKQFEMAKLDEAREGAIVQVAEVAVPPDKRSSPHRTLTVILLTLIAFCTALVWAFAAERWRLWQLDPNTRGKILTLRHSYSKAEDSPIL